LDKSLVPLFDRGDPSKGLNLSLLVQGRRLSMQDHVGDIDLYLSNHDFLALLVF
jgi:hypothetical protein